MAKFSDEKITEAIDMYRSGAKVTEIEEATGVHRAGLYYHMQRRGLAPSRQPSANRGAKSDAKGDPKAFEYALGRVEELVVENQRLRGLLEQHGIAVE